jgi:uncharacterized repeat protein (TIGR03803 family)
MKSGGSKNLAIRSLCLLAAAIALLTQSPSAQAQTLTVLHSFTGTANDGNYPQTAPIRDLKGNLYGVALGGIFGRGMIFKVSGTGHETVLYSFKGYPDGDTPDSISFRDSAGNLFGTTYQGGANNFGTVFKLDTHGSAVLATAKRQMPDWFAMSPATSMALWCSEALTDMARCSSSQQQGTRV